MNHDGCMGTYQKPASGCILPSRRFSTPSAWGPQKQQGQQDPVTWMTFRAVFDGENLPVGKFGGSENPRKIP